MQVTQDLASFWREHYPRIKALRWEIEMNWNEVRRLAQLPEYRNLSECETLVQDVADELKIKSPLHSD